MRRLGLRARLMLAFAPAMAAVLVAIGLFVALRVSENLTRSVDQGLRARAADVATLESQADQGLSSSRSALGTPAGSFGQLIDRRGRIYDSTPGLPRRPLLSPAELARARRGPVFAQLSPGPGGADARVFAVPITAQGLHLVLVVGSSLAGVQSALASLRTGLLLAGPAALLLASAGGWLLAGAALREVERMRARAAGLSAAGRGERLPVSPAGDEVSRLGRTLNGMLERLDEARAREQQFLADASHELRTPLALLKAELELALDSPRGEAELRAALGSAQEETDRLVHLSEDLLVLARADHGSLPLRLEPVDALELGHRLQTRFGARASRASRAIHLDVEPSVVLTVDVLRIEQALGNLIDNSLRHGAGDITLEVHAQSEAVEIRVSDEGPGIPAQLRSAAFERFTRDERSPSDKGAGLGLAIVAAIAEAHGGTAVLGPGSEVRLRLPIAVGAAVSRGDLHGGLTPTAG